MVNYSHIAMMAFAVITTMIVQKFSKKLPAIVVKGVHRFFMITALYYICTLVLEMTSSAYISPGGASFNKIFFVNYTISELIYAFLKYTGLLRTFFLVPADNPAFMARMSLYIDLKKNDILGPACVTFIFVFVLTFGLAISW